MENTQRSYKATYNGKCRDITYEIGKTYTFNGEISLCSSGFHFCNDFDSLLKYYPMKSDLKIFEIKVLGEIITKGNKSVTNSLKILKEIPLSKFKKALKNQKYDKNNNLIHHKNSKGIEYWNEYDKNNNLIHCKDSDGNEEWNEYDKNNNLIHYKNSKGIEWSITIE
jgi:YD repeat-containing protein